MKKRQVTLVFLKPDCIRKGYQSEVMKMISDAGLSVIEMTFKQPSRAQFYLHYEGIGKLLTRLSVRDGQEKAAILFEEIVHSMRSERLLFLLVEGEDSVNRMRVLAGATRPWEAEEGTIRRRFGKHSREEPLENVLYCSANAEEAELEIALWFPRFVEE